MVLRAREEAVVSVRLRTVLRQIWAKRPRRECKRRGGDGHRDRPQPERTGRRGDPGILSGWTKGRQHSNSPGWLGQGRAQAWRRSESDRIGRSAAARDI